MRRRRPSTSIDDQTLFLPVGGSLTDGLRELDPRLYERYLRIRSTATRLEALRHPRPPTFIRPSREELDQAAATIRSPMLVIVGDLDRIAPNAQVLAEAVPSAKLHVVAGAPHNGYYETAAQYNEAVSAFQAELELLPVSRAAS